MDVVVDKFDTGAIKNNIASFLEGDVGVLVHVEGDVAVLPRGLVRTTAFVLEGDVGVLLVEGDVDVLPRDRVRNQSRRVDREARNHVRS